MKRIILTIALLIITNTIAFCQIVKEDNWYAIIACSNNRALTIQGKGNENGLQITPQDSTGGDNQLFGFKKIKGGYYQIISKLGHKALEIKEGSMDLHGAVQQNEINDSDIQLFAIVRNAAKTFAIVNKNSGYGFDIFKETVIQYQMYGNINQTFRIVLIRPVDK